MRLFFFIFIAMFFWQNIAISNNYKASSEDSSSEDLKKIFNTWLKGAEKDLPYFQYLVSQAYLDEKYTKPNKEESFKWLQRSAENNYDQAYYQLGEYYRKGIFVEKNIEKSFYHYKKAADLNPTFFSSNVSELYEHGIGTEKDLFKSYIYALIYCGDDRTKQVKKLEKHFNKTKRAEAKNIAISLIKNDNTLNSNSVEYCVKQITENK